MKTTFAGLFALLASPLLASAAFAGAPAAAAPTPSPTPAAAAAVAQPKPKIDCSKAATGLVKIRLIGGNMTAQQAAEIAYQCLSTKNAKIVAQRKKVIKASYDSGSKEQCGNSDPVQTLVISSWVSGRPYPTSNGSGLYGTGGDTSFLVREPITCGGVGSGLYDGIVGAVSVQLDVSNNDVFSLEDENKPVKQDFTIKFVKFLSL